MQHGGIDARVDHRRMDAFVALCKAFGERTRLIVHVPVERLGEEQALRVEQAQSVDIDYAYEQPGEVLATLDDAELRRLLDRIGGVAARVGEPHDLRLRRLRL